MNEIPVIPEGIAAVFEDIVSQEDSGKKTWEVHGPIPEGHRDWGVIITPTLPTSLEDLNEREDSFIEALGPRGRLNPMGELGFLRSLSRKSQEIDGRVEPAEISFFDRKASGHRRRSADNGPIARIRVFADQESYRIAVASLVESK